jgi:hypothetical protein
MSDLIKCIYLDYLLNWDSGNLANIVAWSKAYGKVRLIYEPNYYKYDEKLGRVRIFKKGRKIK